MDTRYRRFNLESSSIIRLVEMHFGYLTRVTVLTKSGSFFLVIPSARSRKKFAGKGNIAELIHLDVYNINFDIDI